MNTRWTYHTSLAAWFQWLKRMEYRSDSPIDKVGRPRRARGEPHPVSDDNMRRLLRVRCRRRTKAMILLAAMQGLRPFEIAKVKGEHFDLIDRTMIVTGKGGATATLPMHPMLVEQAYQMLRRGFWFPGVANGHQRSECISGTIKEAMVRAGVPGSAHSLRDWFGTALMMRHANLSATAIYAKVADEQRVKGIHLLDPFQLATTQSATVSSGDVPATIAELRRQATELLAAAQNLADGGVTSERSTDID